MSFTRELARGAMRAVDRGEWDGYGHLLVPGIGARVFVVAVLLAACGTHPAAGLPDAALGTWSAPDGRSVGGGEPPFQLAAFRGAEHCDWQDAFYLVVALPGNVAADVVNGVYSRDPSGVLPGTMAATFSDDANLPSDARFTGYRHGDVELWVAPSRADREVYLKLGTQVERWPRQLNFFLCA